MKRSILVGTLFLVTSFLVSPNVFAATKPTPTVMMKHEASSTSATTSSEVSPTPTPAVDYTLAYPGMLPNNPLYFLKQFRDWVMDLLIADPMRKIDFYVLQSDKDINAATMLIASSEGNDAAKMVTEATMYMKKAVAQAEALKSGGQQVPTYVVQNVQNAIAKHEEVLTGLANSLGSAQKSAVADALSQMKILEADVAKLK